jgi:hypothetical protein
MEPHPYGQAFAERDLERLPALPTDGVGFHTLDIADPAFQGGDSVATVLAMVVDAITEVEYTQEVSAGPPADRLRRDRRSDRTAARRAPEPRPGRRRPRDVEAARGLAVIAEQVESRLIAAVNRSTA